VTLLNSGCRFNILFQGWQWSASTGTDPQPYFRIFNPYSQSLKADPTGDYIRTFVPVRTIKPALAPHVVLCSSQELASLRGNGTENATIEALRLNYFSRYPQPVVCGRQEAGLSAAVGRSCRSTQESFGSVQESRSRVMDTVEERLISITIYQCIGTLVAYTFVIYPQRTCFKLGLS
jgi:hypothetical protein